MKRENFIRDLFNPKTVLLNFREIEFESFDIFVRLKDGGYLTNSKTDYMIPINIKQHMFFLRKLSDNSYFFDKNNINFLIPSDQLMNFFNKFDGLENKHFNIITDDKIDFSLNDLKENNKAVKWVSQNRLFIETTIDYNNYKTKFNDLLTIYNMKRIRFFYIRWDYESFEDMTLKEMKEFEYRVSHFMIWSNATVNEKKYDNQRIIINRGEFRKKLFIDNEMKLYLTREAFEDGDVLFDFEEHKNHNGESVPYYELNVLRKYIDLEPKNLSGITSDISYVDFYQNKKITKDICIIPFITEKVGDIIYGF